MSLCYNCAKSAFAGIQPHAWQREAFQKWVDNQYKGVVDAATGVGKTHLAFMCLDAYREMHPDATITILVPKEPILNSWVKDIEDYLAEKGLAVEENLGIFYGKTKKSHHYDEQGNPILKPINIAINNTASTLFKDHFSDIPHHFLIVDEVHRICTPNYIKLLDIEFDACLGISATHERKYNPDLTNHMVLKMGGVIYRYGYRRALDENVIAQFDIYNVALELTPQERKQYRDDYEKVKAAAARIKSMSPVERKSAEKAMYRANLAMKHRLWNSPTRRRCVMDLVRQYPGKKILLFHQTILGAGSIHHMLLNEGYRAVEHNSEVKNPKESLRRFSLPSTNPDSADIMVSAKTLIEGVNLPQIQVAIIVASTSSLLDRVQSVGRAIRKTPDDERKVIYGLFASNTVDRSVVCEMYSPQASFPKDRIHVVEYRADLPVESWPDVTREYKNNGPQCPPTIEDPSRLGKRKLPVYYLTSDRHPTRPRQIYMLDADNQPRYAIYQPRDLLDQLVWFAKGRPISFVIDDGALMYYHVGAKALVKPDSHDKLKDMKARVQGTGPRF